MSVVLEDGMDNVGQKKKYDTEFETDTSEVEADPEDKIGPAKMCIASWWVVPVRI